VAGFEYYLPAERIALWPAAERDASRLLVVERHGSGLEHRLFRDLPSLLDPGDLLVLNDSRVFPARLRGQRSNGARIELLLTERLDAAEGGSPPSPSRPPGGGAGGERWAVLARASGKIRPGETWSLGPGLEAEVLGRLEDERLEVVLRSDSPVLELAEERGETPLPPYIRRPVDPAVDPQRYQTVYARRRGSCAAPTAGLHFTPALLDTLRTRGVRTASLTLHVGWATFRPRRPGEPVAPRVPPEPFDLPEATARAIDEARRRGGRVVAVGTTCARVLEERATEGGRVRPGSGRCALTIVPGHRFRVVEALLTNFHLPGTSLLMLVAAFAGDASARAAYAGALSGGYRFYSYGDAMLVRAPGRGARAL
jgi:S-adenosylmethionine:tRNA ribosyltransferase-isomerase